MIILGIDPGVALLGWGIIKKNDEPELLAYGCIETKKGEKQEDRLFKIYNEFRELLKKHKPEVVCMENLFFNTNAKTALLVGEARGVMKICTVLANLPLVEFTPLQIKGAVTGYGRADKRQVQEMVKTLLGLPEIIKPDDAADAVATALTYCYYNRDLES